MSAKLVWMPRALAVLCLGVALRGAPAASELESARKLYQSTEYEKSLQVLQPIQNKNGEMHALIGRNYYMLGDYHKASDVLEKAVAADPGNSEYAMWLARAYGRRAETSSPVTAPGLASRARQWFERSVQLNPKNLDALNDLLEYYMEAPGFLGGGFDKATATARRIGEISPAEGNWAMARLAEKKKEYGSAEQYLQRAIEAAPQQVGKLLDLARLLTTQGRYQEAEQRFDQAQRIAPDNPKILYVRAASYVKSKRNLNIAIELLKRYMNSPLTADDPPRSDAAKLLRQAQGG
jgi:tetratricopeptide (TPR) repeat protein